MTVDARVRPSGLAVEVSGEGADLAGLLAARALAARGLDKLPDDAVFRLATGRSRY